PTDSCAIGSATGGVERVPGATRSPSMIGQRSQVIRPLTAQAALVHAREQRLQVARVADAVEQRTLAEVVRQPRLQRIQALAIVRERSEERRVGNECSARWAAEC